MGKSLSSDRLRGRRISKPALGAAISAVIAVLIAALLHANALAIGSFLDDSNEFAQSESALVSTQLSLRTLSQAVLLAEDVNLGVADLDTAATARTEATRAVGDLEARLTTLGIDVQSSTSAVQRSHQVVAELEAGNVDEAGELLATDALTSFEQLRDTVVERRDATLDTLSGAKSMTRRVGTIAGFLVALLAPALAVYAYWRIARRQLDSARSEMDTKLHAERRVIKAKDEFISNISHELRTPLTSIYGFSEILIEQGMIDPDEAHTLISVINEESAELNRMVEDLLTVARDEAGEIAYNNVELSLAEEIETVTRPLQRAGVSVSVDCPPLIVDADQLRLRQIMRNLLSNAQRWGGETIHLFAQRVDSAAVVTVADNGPGVPADVERRLFTRYMHEGNEALTTGTIGLGLAVVKILSEGMGGEVSYEHLDGWTRFVVRLPLAGPETVSESSRHDVRDRHMAVAPGDGAALP
ncbi:MAG: HAMP domain-containing histidine kinase [bacterium]|nr:HAMP domain-containing histidine kinase [bacterium]MCP4966424.1 HAMP domain-containing histidine kinase [bacterium]